MNEQGGNDVSTHSFTNTCNNLVSKTSVWCEELDGRMTDAKVLEDWNVENKNGEIF